MNRTPLFDAHQAAGARFVDFFGWDMPVQYTGILEETTCTRETGGIFDLCHMGRLEVRGPAREDVVERVFSGNLERLRVGRAKYGFLLNEDGYPIDDVLVYRDTDVVHIVVNATGRDKDFAWVRDAATGMNADADVLNVSDVQAMIALQGKISEAVLQPHCNVNLSRLKYYRFANAIICDQPTLIARTGYTGEDGFELFFDKQHARSVWDALLSSGSDKGLQPIGLGARDVLRLEAGMPLYGQEINESIDPLEADLAFGVDLSLEDTIGIPALKARKAEGLAREAASLAQEGGRVPRHGCKVYRGDDEIGEVTSGGISPTVGKRIARILVKAGCAPVGATLDVDHRGKRQPMTVVPAPFYKRPRA